MKMTIALVLAAACAARTGAQTSGSLKAIVDSYLTIQSQLAADKIDDVKGPARAIAAQAIAMGKEGADIAKTASSFENAANIEAAREAFAALTEAVVTAARARGSKDLEGVRLAFCPMVNRSWLQKGERIRNPYYGSSMLTCGEFKPLPR